MKYREVQIFVYSILLLTAVLVVPPSFYKALSVLLLTVLSGQQP